MPAHSESAEGRAISQVVGADPADPRCAAVVATSAEAGGTATQVKNQLQHLALNQGVRRKRPVWSVPGRAVLEQLPLQGWTARRRNDLLAMLDRLE